MNGVVLSFAFLCLAFGIAIIIAALRRSRFVYDKKTDQWYVLKLAPLLYLMKRVYNDLDDKYVIGFHIYLASGFILLSLIIFIVLIRSL
jgi:hypothetical protein